MRGFFIHQQMPSIIYKAVLSKFGQQGEKTGWTYFVIPAAIAEKINPGQKKSFRVKGWLDKHKVKAISLLPMGGGDFIMPINSTMRKALMKRQGDTITASLEIDRAIIKLSPDLIRCLSEEKNAMEYFIKLPPSHQQYYSKWIESAKTEPTKTRRIAVVIDACSNKLSFSEMMRQYKKA